ncbi:hypothetical protein N9L68_03425, partial [bacterium]|nr:hypothetical protein [bacterium]
MRPDGVAPPPRNCQWQCDITHQYMVNKQTQQQQATTHGSSNKQQGGGGGGISNRDSSRSRNWSTNVPGCCSARRRPNLRWTMMMPPRGLRVSVSVLV